MIIHGDGFFLRPIQITDKQALAKHANNKKISDNLRNRFPHSYTQEDAEWFINFVLENNNSVTNLL